jgi:2-methylcitrate dehydratase PrpD
MTTNATQVMASWIGSVRPEDVGLRERQIALDAICDGIGVGLAGSREPLTNTLLETFAPTSRGKAVVLGRGVELSAATAALINGAAIHALDFDDSAHPAYAHPSSVLVPAMLAVADAVPRSGEAVIRAYVVGIQIFNVLGRHLNMDHYLQGWHATGTLGALAGAGALASLLELDEATTVRCLSIAASMASGLRVNFGTMTKPLHAGLAARSAVEAVTLARAGFTAAEDGLGASAGFFGTFSDSSVDPDRLAADLRAQWEISTEFGICLKAFPSCGATHPGIEAALAMRDELSAEITAVRLGVSSSTPAILRYDRPSTGLEGKFSLQHCVAAALLRGRVVIEDFTDESVSDVTSWPTFESITMAVDGRVRDSPEFATVVEIDQADGKRLERTIPFAIGKPSRWLPAEDQWAKFESCVRLHAGTDPRTAWNAVRELAEGGSLVAVSAAVRGSRT